MIFQPHSRGKQYLAINCIACAIANLYKLDEWNDRLIDEIIVHGDLYFQQQIREIWNPEHEISLDDFKGHYEMIPFRFIILPEMVLCGNLYSCDGENLNLSKALIAFLKQFKCGILQCMGKSLAIGGNHRGRYFLFDCQSIGHPLFRENQGCAYILLCTTITRLLNCIVKTLRIPFYNVSFTIHNVKVEIDNMIGSDDDEEEMEEEEKDDD